MSIEKKTMTEREFLVSITEGKITEEIIAFATSKIEKLDERNRKRAEANAVKQAENDGLKEELIGLLSSEPVPASYIAEKLGLTSAKISALARQLVEAGKIQVKEIKAEKGNRNVKGYFINA